MEQDVDAAVALADEIERALGDQPPHIVLGALAAVMAETIYDSTGCEVDAVSKADETSDQIRALIADHFDDDEGAPCN